MGSPSSIWFLLTQSLIHNQQSLQSTQETCFFVTIENKYVKVCKLNVAVN